MLLTFILIIICLHQITVSVETVMTTPQLEAATVTRELELGPQIATVTVVIPAMNCHEVCTVLIDVIKSIVRVGFVVLNGCCFNLRSVSKCHEQFSRLNSQ